MTTAEKIQFYRRLKSMTQKKLSELSGVSEISIRKYEAEERNPKPEQLKKIAGALEIGENLLLDIELNSLTLETLSDFISVFMSLEKSVGAHVSYDLDETGEVDAGSICVKFKNKLVSSALENLALNEHLANSLVDEALREGHAMDSEKLEAVKSGNDFVMEQTRRRMLDTKTPLNED